MVWLHNFRLITLFAFPICSLLVQVAIIFRMFCNKYGFESQKNRCHVNFGATMAVLITLHTVIDAYLYCLVKHKARGEDPIKDVKGPKLA